MGYIACFLLGAAVMWIVDHPDVRTAMLEYAKSLKPKKKE